MTGPDVNPDNFLSDRFSSAQIPSAPNKGDGANFSRCAKKDMDTLVTKAASAADGKVRNQAYCQNATRIADDLPRTSIYEM